MPTKENEQQEHRWRIMSDSDPGDMTVTDPSSWRPAARIERTLGHHPFNCSGALW
jgi:hypothetical protein